MTSPAFRRPSQEQKGTAPPQPWQLAFPPRDWQRAALAKWLISRQGIVEVVTGGGKTVFAFLCMSHMNAEDSRTRFLILVPSLALLDQWVVALRDELGIPPHLVATLGGGERPSADARIVVAVLNSARSFVGEYSSKHPTMLIVDECHRAGSEKNSEALKGTFVATLGLSATPHREYDDGFERYISPALGEVIFSYSYVDASRDSVITPFDLVNVRIPLLGQEQESYDDYTAKITRLRRLAITDPDAELSLKRVLQRRSSAVGRAAWRIPASVKLVDENRQQRVIVFHESVADAEKIVRLLKRHRHNAVIYHAGIDPAVRREGLRLFRRGVHDVLVCCRALDEGMNVPETAVAVVASATASVRQRIQRLGRILRPAAGKTHAVVYTLYATQDEERRLRAEADRLADVSAVKWQRLKVPENAASSVSE